MFSHDKTVRVAILMGSKSDWITMQSSALVLDTLDIKYHVEIISAHRTPDKLFNFAENAMNDGYQVIIAGAGGSAHLPGMLASKTLLPVLGVPIQGEVLSGVDSLYSIVQMPFGIPVASLAIGKTGASNAALFAAQILAIKDIELCQKLTDWRQLQTNEVLINSDPRGVNT